MGSFKDALREVLARLAEFLKLKPSKDSKFTTMRANLVAARADNRDRLDGIKDQIRKLEAAALRKNQELEATKGESKRIIVGEIEQIFRDIDRLRGSENIITANLDKLSVALGKLEELINAQARSVGQDQLDDLALDLQEALNELRGTDRAVKDLERIEYEPPKRATVDVSDRLAQTEGKKEPAAEVSEDIKRRLQKIEE